MEMEVLMWRHFKYCNASNVMIVVNEQSARAPEGSLLQPCADELDKSTGPTQLEPIEVPAADRCCFHVFGTFVGTCNTLGRMLLMASPLWIPWRYMNLSKVEQ